MAGFYEDMRETASSLLTRFGAMVTISRLEKSGYDPATGRHGSQESTEWTPNAVKTNINKKYLEGFSGQGTTQGGSRIAVGDMQIIVDARQADIPQVGDRVVFANGESWVVMEDLPVDPAGMTVVYIGIIRRG